MTSMPEVLRDGGQRFFHLCYGVQMRAVPHATIFVFLSKIHHGISLPPFCFAHLKNIGCFMTAASDRQREREKSVRTLA